MMVNLLLFPGNLFALTLLTVIRSTRWVGFGILAALALNLYVSLVLGVTMNGLCFIPFMIK